MIIIRVRGSSGTQRVELNENSSLGELKSKVRDLFKIETVSLSKTPDGKDPLTRESSSLKELNLNHGDMIYLTQSGKSEISDPSPSQPPAEVVEEDEIDKYLSQQDGWTPRPRDPRLCQHGAHGRCQWCLPIAPYEILNHDPWKKDGVKFIPFHGYLRKQLANQGCKHSEQSRCLLCKSLDPPSYKVKACNKHPPYPDGICTDCKPSECRIDSQSYRHVDNVEFQTPEIIDQFLHAWRQTGNQRFGYLYGRYTSDEYIPLGITANVAAIYEPPQTDSRDGFQLETDSNQENVDKVAASLGLEKVGMIWTDLKTEGMSGKLVQHRKDVILTSDEMYRMCKMQNKYPNPCKQSSTGKLGSKFVSVLLSANETGQIEINAFQASDQGQALVKDQIVGPSKDPHQMKIKKSTKRYIPDVMYIAHNEYNREVLLKASPNFPIDFFIIRLRNGAPKKPNPMFKSFKFQVENRSSVASMSQVKSQVESGGSALAALSDFHLLLFLSTQVAQENLQDLFKSVLENKEFGNFKGIVGNLLKMAPALPAKPEQLGKSTGKEAELEQQLVSMGYSPTQAKEALWATGYKGIEQAIEFLLR